MNITAEYRERLIKRFEEKFITEPNSGCWLWVANIYTNGYGQIKINGRPVGAHRVSWELYRGRIPEDLCVLHKCDNPPCVNPDHLFLGTQADNVADQIKKGRLNPPYGERQGRAKLATSDILAIRDDLRTHKEIAAGYGIASSHVSDIKLRKKWRHL